MSDLLLTHQIAQRVLELDLLNEEVVLGIEAGCHLRALEVEREPLLDPGQSGALREIEEQGQVEHQRSSQDRISAEKIDLDLHRVPEPPEDINVVPAFFVVA